MKFTKFDKPAMARLTVTWRDKAGKAIAAECVVDCSERAVSSAIISMLRGQTMAAGDTIEVQNAT